MGEGGGVVHYPCFVRSHYPSRVLVFPRFQIDSFASIVAPTLGRNHSMGQALMSTAVKLMLRIAVEHDVAVLLTNYTVRGERGSDMKPALVNPHPPPPPPPSPPPSQLSPEIIVATKKTCSPRSLSILCFIIDFQYRFQELNCLQPGAKMNTSYLGGIMVISTHEQNSFDSSLLGR